MKKIILALILFYSIHFLQAHDINYDKVILHTWNIAGENKFVEGSFYMIKDNKIFIETATHQIVNYPLQHLSKADLQFAIDKKNKIESLNNQIVAHQTIATKNNSIIDYKLILLIILFIGFSLFVFQLRGKTQFKYVLPIFIFGLSFTFLSFSLKSLKSTNPSTINAAFTPFVPNIHTFFDTTYFWVESKGIPTTHPMMVGISSTGWQRQVPIPQCYMGTNAWPIPLEPTLASNPIPVDAIHFTRGAIAIAVNGVPIFNEHTNTGADAFTAGQLDTYGGHCGRGDDYHYHIAPLHLYAHTQATLPIAYALDGFAVYGSVEADGTNMQTLDANHGHNYGGTYHYHGTTTYPYMIANMAGNVTEDNTHQLIPQAVAHPVRPGQNPLNGALITACNPNATANGYTLIYTLNGNTDSVVYNWDAVGNYNFKYYTGSTLDSNQTLHGFTQCTVPATPNGFSETEYNQAIQLYPNPVNNNLKIEIDKSRIINSIEIFDLNGRKIKDLKINNTIALINVYELANGLYFIKTIDNKGIASITKFVKE